MVTKLRTFFCLLTYIMLVGSTHQVSLKSVHSATIHALRTNKQQTNDISYPKKTEAIKLCKFSRNLGNT